MADSERTRERLRRLAWPFMLTLALIGLAVLSFQALATSRTSAVAFPAPGATLGVALDFSLRAGARSLPMLLSVLLLAMTFGAVLSLLAIFWARPFDMLLRRVHELSGALPALLLVLLWRMGDRDPSVLGFVLVLSAFHAVEIARMLAETGRRLGLSRLASRSERRRRLRWKEFLQHSVHELQAQLALQAALVASSVFGLDAALAFVGLGLTDVPTWGSIVGTSVRSHAIAPSVTVLALCGIVACVAGSYLVVGLGRVTRPPGRPAADRAAASRPEPEEIKDSASESP